MAKEFNLSKEVEVRKPKPALVLGSFGLQTLKAQLYNFDQISERDESRDLPNSYLGTPVFSNLDIEPGGYKNLEGEQIDYPSIRVDTVLFDVAQQKNIIKTQLQGRNGTVKEYISDGDYSITIRGVIVNPEAGVYPKEQVLDLMKICKAQKAIEVNSWYLHDVFGISNIVIESYVLPQVEGIENIQPFELSCVSDEPIELTINE